MAMPSAKHTDFFCLLRFCIKQRSLTQARLVLAHLTFHGVSWDASSSLGDYVVLTLARCGGREDALSMAYRLPHPLTLFSWNALISSSLHDHDALQTMYLQMQSQGIEPNSHTFVPLVKACACTQDVERGKRLHVVALHMGGMPTSDVFLSSSLIGLYTKCRAIVEAEEVFRTAPGHDIVSWNAMLSGYRETGECVKALKLYRQLQEQDNIDVTEVTFVIIVQVCGASIEDGVVYDDISLNKNAWLEIGRALHSDICKKSLESTLFVGSSLLNMYKKTGSMSELECVFCALPKIDVVACNVVLSAYLEEMQADMALQFYKWMQTKGIHPDKRTFVFVLQACVVHAEAEKALDMEGRSIKKVSLEIGNALHVDACQEGFASFLLVANTLVSMYGKCGAVREAEDAFYASSQHDIVLWTSMLCVYVENGEARKALLLYRQMHYEVVTLDEYSFMFALQACASLAEQVEISCSQRQSSKRIALEIGQGLHSLVRKKRFMKDVFLGNSLISMYGKCGAIVEAEDAFYALSHHDTVSWNALLLEYVEQEKGAHALQLYAHMQMQGVSQDRITYVGVLLACSMLKQKTSNDTNLNIGHTLHSDVCKQGFASDGSVCSALMSMYGRCGSVLEAEYVLDSLPQPSLRAWNAMLSIYTEHKQGEKALELYQYMQKQSAILDELTLIRVLQSCGETGCLRMCQITHFDLISSGCERIHSAAATLIYTYGSCARMEDAQAVLNEMSEPDMVIWNAFLTCNACYSVEAHSFEILRQEVVELDGVTFTSILILCCHTGLVREAIECFESMRRDYGITPNVMHYCIMADLLGRVGDFRRVENMIERMPMHANTTVWLCVLAACRIHGNLDLAKTVLNRAETLLSKQPSLYVLLSNMYVEAGLHDFTCGMGTICD